MLSCLCLSLPVPATVSYRIRRLVRSGRLLRSLGHLCSPWSGPLLLWHSLRACKTDRMETQLIEDDNEHETAGDGPIEWDKLAEVQAALILEPPVDALRSLYGDDLVIL